MEWFVQHFSQVYVVKDMEVKRTSEVQRTLKYLSILHEEEHTSRALAFEFLSSTQLQKHIDV